MRMRWFLHSCVLMAFAGGLTLVACGGGIDTSADRAASAVAVGEIDPVRAAPPQPEDCSTLGTNCQVFEPDGAKGRWGCHTLGTEPELACEHAAGASVARCNCSGMFGERPPGSPSDGIDWFDIPATSRMWTEREVLELWKARCHGRCVPRRVPVPGPSDAG